MMDSQPSRHDKFSLSYGLWCCACLLLFFSSHEIEVARPFAGFLIALMTVAAAVIILIWLAIALVRHVIRHRWRRVASILIGPPIAFVLVLLPIRAGFDLTWLRFEMRKADYLAELQLSPSNEPRLKFWSWGRTGLAVTSSFAYTIVFDESDEIALPAEQRSPEWRDRAEQAGLWSMVQEEYLDHVRKLDGHFYMVTELFP